MLEIRFQTISVAQQPEQQIEVMADWKVFEGLQAIDEGGLDDVEVLDLSKDPLSDFLARTCVRVAREHGQSVVEVVFASQDPGLRREADRHRIREQIRRLSENTLRVRRFRDE